MLEKLQKVGASDQTASRLDDEQILTLFNVLETKNIEKAKKELNYKINHNKDKESTDNIIEKAVKNEQRIFHATLNEKYRDRSFSSQFPPIEFGTPTFEPDQSAINTTSMQRRNNYSR